MQTLKEKLSSIFGGLGCVLWLLLGILLFVMPISLLPLRIWQQIALICILLVFSETFLVGVLGTAIIWIWSFTIAVNMPLNIYSIIYYISLAIYVFTTLIPQIIYMIGFVYNLIANRND